MAAALLLRRNPSVGSLLLRRLLCTSDTTTSSSSSSSSRVPSPMRLRQLIRSQTEPEKIADLFEQGFPHPAFHSDRDLSFLTISKLRRARRPDLIDRVLSAQLSHPAAPSSSEGFLVRILSLYSSAALLDHALRTYHLIPSPRSTLSFNALLTAFLDNARPDLLLDAFKSSLSAHGVTPDTVSHNILLKYLSASDVAAARRLLDEMPDPDIRSYNTLLTGYLKQDDEDGFEEILKQINKRGLTPDVFTYNNRITALCEKGRVFEAEELLDVMAAKKVQPDRLSFNTLVAAFCKAGDVASAMRLLDRMNVVKGKPGLEAVTPNFDTYSPLLRALVESDEFGSALEICNKCLSKKWMPPFPLMKSLVEGLVKGARVEEARNVAEKIKGALRGHAVDAWKKIEVTLPL